MGAAVPIVSWESRRRRFREALVGVEEYQASGGKVDQKLLDTLWNWTGRLGPSQPQTVHISRA